MDQDADYENFEEPNLEDFSEDQITVAPPLESAFAKYRGNIGCLTVF